jgi:hypothetical protein
MPVIARAPVKVLAAYKWVQAKLHRPLLSELRAPNTESFRDAIGGGSCKLRHRKQPRPDDRKAKSRKVSSPAIGRSAFPACAAVWHNASRAGGAELGTGRQDSSYLARCT